MIVLFFDSGCEFRGYFNQELIIHHWLCEAKIEN